MRTIPRILALLCAAATVASVSSAQAPSSSPSALPNAPSAAINSGPCVVQPGQPAPPVNFKLRGTCLVHSTFNLGAVVSPAIGAAIVMARPPDNYPRDWKDGGEAFAHNYGDRVARHTASGLAHFGIAAIDGEDPRYYASTNPKLANRVFHALFFTVIDKNEAGHNAIAISNFAGATAAGFVGMAYLPSGYNDTTHAYQRAAIELSTFGGQNLISEFYPELAKVAHKLHLPVPKP